MKTLKQIVTLLFLSLTFQSFGQAADSTIWYFSGQSENKSVKAYSVESINGPWKNVLVFKNNSNWDTLYLDELSMLPSFRYSCVLDLETVQLDGQGLDELIITFKNNRLYKSGEGEVTDSVHYTLKEFWDLYTRKKIFFATTDYYRFSKRTILVIDSKGKIMDREIGLDSCLYSCSLIIDKAGLITIDDVKQIERCPDNYVWKREGGIYSYKNGLMTRQNSN